MVRHADRLIWGTALGIAAAIVLLLLSPVLTVWTIMAPMVVYGFANGILFPNAMAGV